MSVQMETINKDIDFIKNSQIDILQWKILVIEMKRNTWET